MASPTTDRRFGLNGGVAIKAPCDLATTANITLSGEQTIDGTTTDDSRVLVKNQTDAAYNGIYRSGTGAWVREPDCNGNRDLVTGTLVRVLSGSVNSGAMFEVTSTGEITIGTSDLDFSEFNYTGANYSPDTFTGTGAQTAFTLSNNPGTQANVDVHIDGLLMTPTTDYSVSGTALTFVSAPALGAEIVASYGRGTTYRMRTIVSVTDYGADVTGVASAVTAFQNAVSSFTDGSICVIHVPQGTYLGDMSTLSYGTRCVTWWEEGLVTYSTTAPLAPNVSTNILRINTKYGSDVSRPWVYGNAGFIQNVTDGTTSDKPVVRIQRVASHTGGTAAANNSALSVYTAVTGAAPANYENAIVAQLDCSRTSTAVASNNVAVMGAVFRSENSATTMFGANFVARDEGLTNSNTTKGGLIACELDVVANGLDDNGTGTRAVLDAVARSYSATATVTYGVRVRAANTSVSGGPFATQITNAFYADAGTVSGSGITNGVVLRDVTSALMDLEAGNATSRVSGQVSIGGTRKDTSDIVFGVSFKAYNATPAKVTYASIGGTIVDNTAGAEDGNFIINTMIGSTLTEEARWQDGMRLGTPTGGSKGLGTMNAAGSTSGLFLSLNGGAGLYSGAGTPEGAVVAQLGSLYLNTSGGAGTSLYVKENGSTSSSTGWVGK